MYCVQIVILSISGDGKFWGLSADHSKLSLKRSTFGLSNEDTVWIKSDKERLPWFNGEDCGTCIPYSGKVSRDETFANHSISWISRKKVSCF